MSVWNEWLMRQRCTCCTPKIVKMPLRQGFKIIITVSGCGARAHPAFYCSCYVGIWQQRARVLFRLWTGLGNQALRKLAFDFRPSKKVDLWLGGWLRRGNIRFDGNQRALAGKGCVNYCYCDKDRGCNAQWKNWACSFVIARFKA